MSHIQQYSISIFIKYRTPLVIQQDNIKALEHWEAAPAVYDKTTMHLNLIVVFWVN